MNKNYRQGQILRLLRFHNFHTQEELAQELANVGIETTQVTLSRDIRELGLVKTPDGYRSVRAGSRTGLTLATIAAECLWHADTAGNMCVLKTAPGHASSLASALDNEGWKEVVGTVAGDDTILVVCHDTFLAAKVMHRVLGFVKE